MRCYECFHYNACGNSGMYTDADMCKLAIRTSEIEDLRKSLEKAQKEIKELKIELEYATDCIDEVDDALNRGNGNDWAEQAIANYYHRNDDSL